MVMASRTWGCGGFTHILSNTRCLRTSQREVTPPASEQRAGGVKPNTDNQSVGRPLLHIDYSAISLFKSQLSPFYRGNLAPNSAAASAAVKHPYAPGGAYAYRGKAQKIFQTSERNKLWMMYKKQSVS